MSTNVQIATALTETMSWLTALIQSAPIPRMATPNTYPKCLERSPASKYRNIVAKLTAASGGRSSPSHLPATPSTRSVRTAAMIMIGSWTRRLVDRREDLTPMQTTANATPTPIRTASSRSTSAGGCACQIPNETAPMMAATAVPLTRASFKDPARRGVARAPNKVSAELGSEVTCLANSMKDNGRALELLPIHGAPGSWGELAAKPLEGYSPPGPATCCSWPGASEAPSA